ncbi:MAG: hypothetical protein ABIC36_01085 [bacterium]
MKIPIKIKKKFLSNNNVDDLRKNLRENTNIETSKPLRKGLFFGIAILIVIIIALNCWFLAMQKIVFIDILPKEKVVFGLIDQQALYNQLSPSYQFLNGFYGQGAVSKISNYLSNVGLSFEKDIQPIFKQQIAFVLLPSNSDTAFPFVFLFEKKDSSVKISQFSDKIESELKNDFNFSSKTYRQIKTIILNPISYSISSPNLYTYAEIEDYFVISNSLETLQTIISNIIDK